MEKQFKMLQLDSRGPIYAKYKPTKHEPVFLFLDIFVFGNSKLRPITGLETKNGPNLEFWKDREEDKVSQHRFKKLYRMFDIVFQSSQPIAGAYGRSRTSRP